MGLPKQPAAGRIQIVQDEALHVPGNGICSPRSLNQRFLHGGPRRRFEPRWIRVNDRSHDDGDGIQVPHRCAFPQRSHFGSTNASAHLLPVAFV
jgi:hypothetical protein